MSGWCNSFIARFEGLQAKQDQIIRLTGEKKFYEVQLYVYNMTSEGPIPIKIWHSSVVVYGCEYSYCSEGITKSYSPGNPDKIHNIGLTSVEKKDFEDYIDSLAHESYAKQLYNMLTNSCNVFTARVLKYLNLDNSYPDYLYKQSRCGEFCGKIKSKSSSSFRVLKNNFF